VPQGSDQALITRVATGVGDFVGLTSPGQRQQATNAEWLLERYNADPAMWRDYLQAAARHPHLFQLNESPAIAGHIEPVVAHFAADGLTRQDYFRAVAAEPLLLRQKPDTVINNLETVMTHYAANLPMRREYLQSAIAQPELFGTQPSQVFAAVEAEADRLEGEGISLTCSEPSTRVNHPVLSCSHAAAQGLRR
jgi:hypothetical protein